MFLATAYASRFEDGSAASDALPAASAADVRIRQVEDRLIGLEQTVARFKQDGRYDAQRLALHRAIVGDILTPEAIQAAKPVAGRPPTYFVLGGRSGAGKSKLAELTYAHAKPIVIDADVIKAKFPEYEGWNAAALHEESSDLAEVLLTICRELGVNVVLDATLKSEPPARRKAQVFKRAGYRLELHYMFLPRSKAAERVLMRFLTAVGVMFPWTLSWGIRRTSRRSIV